jgi:hypothetical protein
MYSIIGYTSSQGYCLCEEHADYGEVVDDGNETGKVFPIFEDSEWEINVVCQVCFEEIMEAGGDVRNAIIMHANIGPAAIFHQDYFDERDRMGQAVKEVKVAGNDITFQTIKKVFEKHGVDAPAFEDWSEYFLQKVWGK